MKTEPTWPLQRMDPCPVEGASRIPHKVLPQKLPAKSPGVRNLTLTAVAACIGLAACPLQAGLFTQRFDDLNLLVPDGSPMGVSDTRAVPSGLGTIVEVAVSLEVIGGYTGDLYALLIHDGVSAVLLNRPGRRTGDEYGYADVGLDVTFQDTAPADVNDYRMSIHGSHEVPLSGALTGLWQPDARAVDPGDVLNTSTRSAFLSAFVGNPAEGNWTLYTADLSPVGEAVVQSWSLTITTVPEPSSVVIVTGLGVLAWAVVRGTRKG